MTNMAMLLGGQGLAPGLGIPGLGGALMSPIQDKKQRELFVTIVLLYIACRVVARREWILWQTLTGRVVVKF